MFEPPAILRYQMIAAFLVLWPSGAYGFGIENTDRTMLAVYLFSLVFLIGLVASYAFFRFRDGGARLSQSQEQTLYLASKDDRRLSSTPIGMDAVSVEDLKQQVPIAQLLTGAVSGSHECPECGRHFDVTLSVCPFDASLLKSTQMVRQVEERWAESSPVCRACGRQYEDGARFCRHEGTELSRSRRGDRVAVVHVCAACGSESTEGAQNCCEHPEHRVIDPLHSRHQLPIFPMSICPACHILAGPGVTHCEHDDEILRPLLNLHVNVLSVTGMGPRRKVCKKCGTRYSLAANHCAKDGEPLVGLN